MISLVKNIRKKSISHSSLTPFLLFIFFAYLADNLIGFLYPILITSELQNNTVVGILLSLSAVTGLVIDFVAPKALRKFSWKKIGLAGFVFFFLLPILLYIGIQMNLVLLFVLATMLWSVYYELLGMSQQSFMVSNYGRVAFSRNWSLVYFLIAVTGVLSPIIGSFLISNFQNESFIALLFIISRQCASS
jgi:hypothetical protein